MVREESYINTSAAARSGVQAAEWLVLHTRPRQEKAVARHLRACGHHYYLPLVDRVTFSRGRKSRSEIPLFQSYVFAFGTREVAYSAISCGRIANIIPVADQERFVSEIEQIARAIESDGELELHPFAVEGAMCRVRSGPFAGLEGPVIKRKSSTRLILHLSILGRGAALEIDVDLLEPVE